MLLILLACHIVGKISDENAFDDAKSKKEYLNYVKLTYMANRGLFPVGTIESDFVSGRAASAEDGRAGRITKALSAHCLYAHDGRNTRNERLYDEQDLIKSTTRTGDQLRSAVNSFRALADGQSCMRDLITPKITLDGLMHSAQIHEDAKLVYHDFFFPLNLWNPNPVLFDPVSDIDGIQRGDYALTALDPKASIEGHDVVRFSFRVAQVERTYWVDLKRGAIPLQILHVFQDKERTFRLNNDDLRHVDGAGWIPWKLSMFVDSPNMFRQLVIRKVKFDLPPERSFFRLDFAKPVKMVDAGRKLVYKPRASWGLMELPSAGSGQASKLDVAVYQTPAPPMPGERAAWPPWSFTLIIVGGASLVLMLLLVFVAIKRRA